MSVENPSTFSSEERSAQNNLIRVAHSPDADDAFMFYGMAENKVDTEGLQFTHHLVDIETLNHEAFQATYELTALSFHAYAHVHSHYIILPVGASIGDQYGPVLIAKQPMQKADLAGKTIAVPGTLTTAYLALKIWEPSLQTVSIPFDEIMPRVASGEFDAGLIIHEGQLTYQQAGFHKIVDLGEWWFELTNLVLPLGCNGIRRNLGPERIQQVGRVLKRSIQYGLDHRQEALTGALRYARDLADDRAKADQFVGMYVNAMTLDLDPEIKKAVKLLLWMGHGVGVVPSRVEPEYVTL